MEFRQTLCTLILWRSGLDMLMREFRHFLTELSSCHMTAPRYFRITFLFSFQMVQFVTKDGLVTMVIVTCFTLKTKWTSQVPVISVSQMKLRCYQSLTKENILFSKKPEAVSHHYYYSIFIYFFYLFFVFYSVVLISIHICSREYCI